MRFPKKWDVRQCLFLHHEITRMRLLLNVAVREALEKFSLKISSFAPTPFLFAQLPESQFWNINILPSGDWPLFSPMGLHLKCFNQRDS